MDIFFTVEIGHANKKKRSKLKMKLLYTQMYTLKKGESADLSKPVDLIRNVWFRMPYRDMRNHVIRIDLWKVSKWTLNTYFGTCERTLWSIATSSMDLGVMIKKKLTKQEVAKKKTPYDVARVRCSISLEEIFDFRISFDNWTFKTNPDHPDAGKINGERKKITLIVPKNRRAKASVHSLLRPHNSKARSSQWCDCDDGQYFWAKPSPRPFVFTGTRTYLSNSYFCVSVDTGDPPLGLDSGAYPGTQIGKALLGLTSILEISVFKGTVKALSNETNRYKVGELVGNVKAMECSYGRDTAEFDIVTRPEQPKGAGMVTHLNETEQHLVVRITKCEGLPVADFDTGSSDPYLRVKWDGMVLLSPVLQRTIRPVFNHSFFFPVRLAYQQMRKDLRYAKALEVEMLCKGPVDIQVWDDDETSSDFLGGYLLDVADIIGTKHKEARTIVGAGKKRVKLEDDDSSDEEENQKGKRQWYDKEYRTRIFDGAKIELEGCSLANNNSATVTFEAYFWPDFPSKFRVKEMVESLGDVSRWIKLEESWDGRREALRSLYEDAFPDSIGAKPTKGNPFDISAIRRFPATCLHPQTRAVVPLPALICPIIIPQEMARPMKLLHWINCISFSISTKQDRTGHIPNDGIKNPSFFLAARRGPPQDHVLLLCCVLLGLKNDAYVVKGTICCGDKLKEHTWVMTLEKDGQVTFWETTMAQRYHLPKRWSGDKKPKSATEGYGGGDGDGGAKAHDVSVDIDDTDAKGANHVNVMDEWEGEVADNTITWEVDLLPVVGRAPRAKSKAKAKVERQDRDALKKKLMAQKTRLPFAPNASLITDDTLYTDLPYDSIEIVFNGTNVWANLQNHHPALIKYDLHDVTRWEPFLRPEDVAQVEHIDGDVVVPPPLRVSIVDRLREDVLSEMRENMRMYRAKKGLDTFFDEREDLMLKCVQYLDFHERRLDLDPDACPPELREDLAAGDPPLYAPNLIANGGDDGWKQISLTISRFQKRMDDFPVQKGKQFRGFPVHFCTADTECIRTYLMEFDAYRRMLDWESDQIMYTVACKIYPLLGGILSVWLMLAQQVPIDFSNFDGEKE
eukprot:GEMP01003287.1.p1 GENE.GEMP01003287.1~~GEMP01003287.1.p1  ORF type:complete len:1079 (+),score=267.65 GEMP01003287.1:694-3930(+)